VARVTAEEVRNDEIEARANGAHDRRKSDAP